MVMQEVTPQKQPGEKSNTKDDMFKSMLRMHGFEGQGLEYLFDKEEEEEDDDDESESSSVSPMGLVAQSTSYSPSTTEEDPKEDEQVLLDWEKLFSPSSSSPSTLELQPLEEEEEEDPNNDNDQNNTSALEEWKHHLQAATQQQVNLQQQMEKLKQKQQQTSPSKNSTSTSTSTSSSSPRPSPANATTPRKKVSFEEKKTSPATAAAADNPSLQERMLELMLRNEQLEKQWQDQTSISENLQQQLETVQARASLQEKKWQSERQQRESMLPRGEKDQEHLLQLEKDRRIELELKCRGLQQQLNAYHTTTSPRLETLKQLKLQHSQEIKSWQQRLESQATAYEALQDTYESLQIQHAQHQLQHESSAKALKQKNQNHVQEIKKSKAALVKTQRELVVLQERYTQLETKHTQQQGIMQQELIDADHKFQNQLFQTFELKEQLAKQTYIFQSKLEETKVEIALQEEQYKKTITDFESRIQKLQTQHQQETTKMATALAEYRQTLHNGEQFQQLGAQLEEANAKHCALEERYIQETTEWNQLFQNSQHELNNVTTQYESLLETYQNETKEWQNLLGAEMNNSEDTEPKTNKSSSRHLSSSFSRALVLSPEERIQRLATAHAQEIEDLKRRLEQETSMASSVDLLETDGSQFTPGEQSQQDQIRKLELEHAQDIADLQHRLEQEASMESSRDLLGNDESQLTTGKSWKESLTVGMLSPILPATPYRNGLQVFGLSDESLSYSIQEEEEGGNKSQSSMDHRIDDLMLEMGKMDQERSALFQNGVDPEDTAPASRMLETTDCMETMARDMQQEDIDAVPSSSSGEGSSLAKDQCLFQEESKDDVTGIYDSRALLLNTTSDSHNLEKTISLLHNLKDLMAARGNDDEKEASILEQLEVLSEMMHNDSDLSLLSSPRQLKSENRLTLLAGGADGNSESANDVINTSTAIESFRSSTVDTSFATAASRQDGELENPWPALVEELRHRIRFLENDRHELARLTHEMLEIHHDSAQVTLDAAVATAKRETMEQFQQFQNDTQEHMRKLYQTLCVHCQRCIYTAL